MTNSELTIALVNNTGAWTVYAYVTGHDINRGGEFVLIQADGRTPYYPQSPDKIGAPLAVDCGIRLGPSGSTPTTITIPQIAGGRIYVCVDETLTFLLNPGPFGPGLVEPSVSNPADLNYGKNWGFCEFTFNSAQLFANISYVDFVSLPISLALTNTSGSTQTVPGIPGDGLHRVCEGLIAQQSVDGAGWDQLIVRRADGAPLRALSPNTGIVMNPSLFRDYYTNYVNAVWSRYSSQPLNINTQVQWGVCTAQVVNNALNFFGIGTFAKPSAADIFNCSSGPFAASPVNTALLGNLGARLAAAFNRSTILTDSNQPDGENVANYYKDPTTNHYSRIVHEVEAGGRGYAFPYDDVAPDGGVDVSGSVSDGSPQLLTVTLGWH